MMIIGKGTCLVKCQFCGKTMLDGELTKHWLSDECKKSEGKLNETKSTLVEKKQRKK